MATDTSLKHPSRRLGTILLEEGVITEGQLQEALEAQKQEGGFLGKILVEMGYVSESVLITFLVKQCKIPHIGLMDYEIGQDLIELVPKETCLKHHLLPIDKLGRILTVAMVDPLDVEALEQVRESCPDLRIKPILCSWKHYEHVIRRVFPEAPREPEELPEADFGLLAKPAKKPAKEPETDEDDADSIVLVDSAGQADEVPEIVAEPFDEPEAEAGPGPRPATAAATELASLDRVRKAVARLGKGKRGRTTDTTAGEDFVALIEKHVQKAMDEVVAGLVERIGELVADSADGTLPISSMELVEAVRSAMNNAMDEAVGLLLYQVQQALNRAKADASDLSAQDLADLLRVSMRQSMQDVSTALLRKTAQAVLRDELF